MHKLGLKSKSRYKAYKKHIVQFIETCGEHATFTQPDLDIYLEKVKKDDDDREPNLKECAATKKQRSAALTFYLNKCLGLGLSLDDYSIKSTK